MKKIIFDTDIGGDCDDVVALDLLLSAERTGDCELLGVTYSSDNEYAPAMIYAILKQHGRHKLPIGKAYFPTGTKKHADNYSKPVADAFPDENAPTYENTPSAVSVLRRLIVENGHVTLVVTGFLTNIAALIKSEPDDISPLSGAELMREYVDEIALMACNFSHMNGINPMPQALVGDNLNPVPEYNIVCDLEAAKYTFENCPSTIVCSPFELGFKMISGKPLCEYGAGKLPDSLALKAFGAVDGRDSWDPATALYGVYGTQSNFYRSAAGKITIDDGGISHFDTLHGGKHYILECRAPQNEIGAQIDKIVMQLFD